MMNKLPALNLEHQSFGPLRLNASPEEANVFGDIRLTRATKPLDVQVWFGEPTSDSSAGGLRWIDFERGGATLALEFTAKGLNCVQLYAEGYACRSKE